MKKSRVRPSLTHSTATDFSRTLSRRSFLRASMTLGAGLTVGGLALPTGAARRNVQLPNPQQSGLEHVVVVMMENRSFDHFLGWLPGADGPRTGQSYQDENGVSYPIHPLAPDYTGCGFADPDHTYEGGRIELNGGACDGWLRAGDNDEYAIGYYVENDLPFLGAAARAWTTYDRYFAAILAGTYPNRIYQHAAQTDRLDNSLLPISTLPTIWDRLADHSLKGRYYFSDLPMLALWGTKYVPISRPITEFFADCAAGDLPEVSFVEPRFLGAGQGLSSDDHPFGDIRNGEAFLNAVYQAVTSSPAWENTALVINFDEWGGFFEHVPPSVAPIPSADAALGSDGLRGFRVPALLISPWSPRGTVNHALYDHTSVLKMIEWRWHLRALTVRDASANNLAESLDFTKRSLLAPQFDVPPGPFVSPCLPTLAEQAQEQALFNYISSLGFPLPF